MSFDKAIEHHKGHREPYHGAKAIDHTCRNHGGCPWCEENRKYRYIKAEQAADEQMQSWNNTTGGELDEIR